MNSYQSKYSMMMSGPLNLGGSVKSGVPVKSGDSGKLGGPCVTCLFANKGSADNMGHRPAYT